MGKGKKIVIAIIIAVLAAGLLLFGIFKFQSAAVDKSSTENVSVQIPMGSTAGSIANMLEEKDLIKSSAVFKINLRLSGKSADIKAGNYSFTKQMDNDEIINIITSGVSTGDSVTIPEGYTVKDIASRLASKGIVTEQEFLSEIKTGKFNYDFLDGSGNLEGYLYPNTYNFHKGMSAHEIIDVMLKEFDKKMDDSIEKEMKSKNLDYNKVVTMASIVQKEAGSVSEMPKIASVFYNRLKIKMPLQSCSTVQYVLGKTKPKLTIKDTRTPSPYNTYINKDLPPGPICSPGLDAIKAAISPAKTEYLYFLAKGDGTTVFHKDYNEFLKDKEKYIHNVSFE